MRIVHTSDWHAGRVWKGRHRLDETAAVLDHLVGFVESERVDLVVHSGDVFDSSMPVGEAERLVFQFLKRVGRAGAKTVVIAGNHDNPARMQAWGLLSELADAYTVARLVRPDQGGVMVLDTRSGERARIAALPFASMGTMLSAAELAVGDGTPYAVYADAVRTMLAALCAPFEGDAVNLLIAHAMIEGARVGTSERRATIGNEWATAPQALSSRAQYIGLGHIHRPQRIDAAPAPTFYAGSLLQMDFGEAGETKSFVFVEATPGRPARARTIPYEGARQLRRATMTLPELEAQAAALRAEGCYLEVTVVSSRYDPDVASKVRRLLPEVLAIHQEYPEQLPDTAAARRGLGPQELFALYYRSRHGAEPTEAVREAFARLHDGATTGAGSG